ncbi:MULTISPECIES: CidA/LrgA family protein [Rhodanobacter]|jgi:holin-like protein|uniref:Holin-like protein n=1 Tax=Rhodanobacter glycinis TaxID=582702 RepID=A0A1I4EGC0_9GAMM|nr:MULTISPECIES: CidA/LrgA family protein [Rhodanobacter]EIL96444.1 LrgA family protein [Rhodanobacter sp. 115]SFL04040.1 holin-like protein [Rhodanobacter glycinis]
MKTLHARMRLLDRRHPRLALLVQVLLLVVLCAVCEYVVRAWRLPVPGSVLALGVLLLMLACGVVPMSSLRRGADWLLAEMLLFFIPAVMAVSQHAALLRAEGVRIVAVILIGTVLVMTATAFLVDLVWRWRQKHHAQ